MINDPPEATRNKKPHGGECTTSAAPANEPEDTTETPAVAHGSCRNKGNQRAERAPRATKRQGATTRKAGTTLTTKKETRPTTPTRRKTQTKPTADGTQQGEPPEQQQRRQQEHNQQPRPRHLSRDVCTQTPPPIRGPNFSGPNMGFYFIHGGCFPELE